MGQLIHDNEPLTRFLKPSYYAKTKNLIKPSAFDPYPKGEVSVYRIANLVDEDIWYIADNYVVPKSKDFKGFCEARADFSTELIRKQKLDVIPDTEPHELHANIVNWIPDPTTISKDAREEAKKKWQEVVSEIILESNFVLRAGN